MPLFATSSKSISSSSLSRWSRLCTVWKFVSIPPSQRWLTYGMPTRVGLLGHRLLGLLLGADEEDRAAVGDGLLDEVVGAVDERQRLLQVDDVDAVALGEDEALHLGVPAPGLVPEVHAALEELAHGDDGHAVFLLVTASARRRAAAVLSVPRAGRSAGAPGARDVRAGPSGRSRTERQRPAARRTVCGHAKSAGRAGRAPRVRAGALADRIVARSRPRVPATRRRARMSAWTSRRPTSTRPRDGPGPGRT